MTLEQMLTNVYAAVEATDYEQFCLWQKFHDRFNWESGRSGFGVYVGSIAKKYEVYISVMYATIEGKHVVFYHDTSAVVDHNLIKKWVSEKMPNAKHTDAQNFLNIF